MHRCPILTRRFNRCLLADLASIPFGTKIPYRRFFRRASDAPMLMRRFFRCYRPKSFQGVNCQTLSFFLELTILDDHTVTSKFLFVPTVESWPLIDSLWVVVQVGLRRFANRNPSKF